jgi:putative ABC transport system permease protein
VVDLALKTLLHDKLRFFITVAGVAFAVTLVLVQGGLFVGILDNATITIEHLDADLWITSRNTPNLDFVHDFPESYVNRVRDTEGVERADNLILTFVNVNLPTGAQESAVVYALEDFGAWHFPWDLRQGATEDLKRGPYVIFDDSAAKRFGAFQVGDYREIQNQRFEIIGTTHGAKSFTTTPLVFMDYDRVQSLNPDLLRGNTSYVLVKAKPGVDVGALKAALAAKLPYNDVYTKTEWAARSRSYWIVNTGIGFNAFLTVFLGCLVGIVVVAQTLYTSTMEHIKEFGTVKAIGGSNADIYKILARQAGVSAVVGFVMGVVPSFALRPLVEKADLKLIIPPEFTALVFAGTLVLCLAAAMISFRKVASIDPGLVFRT